MQDIINYICHKYGLLLSEDEAEDLVEWYEYNKSILINEDITDRKTKEYLYEKYKGRTLHIRDEDLSNMKYLLAILKGKNNG